jgi:hypothetical protein
MKTKVSRKKPTNGEQRIPPPKATSGAASPEDIARRAHEIYLEGGCQEGRAFEDWIQAEKELEEPIRT